MRFYWLNIFKPKKYRVKITVDDIRNDLIFIYDNCNILNNKSIRGKLKPIIDLIVEGKIEIKENQK